MISTISQKNEAHLLVYQLKLSATSSEYEAKLNKTLKKFTGKPITQVRKLYRDPSNTLAAEFQRGDHSSLQSVLIKNKYDYTH